MLTHIDEMHKFIRLASVSYDNILNEDNSINSSKYDKISNDDSNNSNHTETNELILYINEIIDRLNSYRDLSDDQSYAMGVEVGVQMAAEMLEQLIKKYK